LSYICRLSTNLIFPSEGIRVSARDAKGSAIFDADGSRSRSGLTKEAVLDGE